MMRIVGSGRYLYHELISIHVPMVRCATVVHCAEVVHCGATMTRDAQLVHARSERGAKVARRG